MFVASPCLPQCERPDLFQPLPHMRPVVAGKNYERKVTLPLDTTVGTQERVEVARLRKLKWESWSLYKFGEVAQVCWDIPQGWSFTNLVQVWYSIWCCVAWRGTVCMFSLHVFFPTNMPSNARGNVRNAKPNRKMDGATCAWDAWKLCGRSQWQWLRIQSWKSLLRKGEVCEPLKELYMSGMFSRSSFWKHKTTSS